MEQLKYLIENDMIDMAYVQAQFEMNKRKEYLEKHKYRIWKGKDGKWRTYLPDTKVGRKQLKRNTQKEIENAVVRFYESQDTMAEIVTFKDMYFRWRKVQDKLVDDNTITKYETDYKRYFEDADFSKKDIKGITEEDIKIFVCETVKTRKLSKKACKTLFGYVKRVMNSARINHIISDKPMEFMEAKAFYKYCTEKKKPVEAQIISDMEKLYERFKEDYRNNPSYIPTYAVEFPSLTGMRVEEIAALSWSNIFDSYILVDKSEKYNRRTKDFYIDSTKNGKERVFPITEEIRGLLERVKKAELQYGFICEWVFAGKEGRIHAYRRTVNSKMRCEGVSATVAAALLGHSEEVNRKMPMAN